jgi:hypothetical protein
MQWLTFRPAGVVGRRGHGGVGLLVVVAALLAAFAVPGVSRPVALASSQTLTWTHQHPATHPPAMWSPSMAYDTATGTVVLFGGEGSGPSGDTWTWDGTTWTQQHPATSPPATYGASMAYDAANGTVVLFLGYNGSFLNDTWVWDGTTWTKQAPATSPPIRMYASMAYDTATGTVVLFGGWNPNTNAIYRGTWVWDGTTWTKQHPATHPAARESASMASDAANGTVVLFGGWTTKCCQGAFGDTWVWGST